MFINFLMNYINDLTMFSIQIDTLIYLFIYSIDLTLISSQKNAEKSADYFWAYWTRRTILN